MPGEHRQVLTDATTTIENPEVRPAAGDVVQHRRDETAEAVIPEMRVRGTPGFLETLLHQRRDRVDPDGGVRGVSVFTAGCVAAVASAERVMATSRMPEP